MTATAATQTDELGPLLTRLTGDEKHLPSATSTIDVLWVLYDRILRVTPEIVDEPDRDRFLLSKGHGLAAYYGRNHDEIFRALERRDTIGRTSSSPGWKGNSDAGDVHCHHHRVAGRGPAHRPAAGRHQTSG